jgi:Ca2+-binding EF-hand superfamily protein
MTPAHPLSFAHIGSKIKQSKDTTRRVYDILVRCLGEWVQSGWDFEMTVPTTGKLLYRQAGGFLLEFDEGVWQEAEAGVDLLPSPRWSTRSKAPLIEGALSARGQKELEMQHHRQEQRQQRQQAEEQGRRQEDTWQRQRMRTESTLQLERPGRQRRKSGPITPPGSQVSSRSSSASSASTVSTTHGFVMNGEEYTKHVRSVTAEKWWVDMKQKIGSHTVDARTLLRKFDSNKSGTVEYTEFLSGLASIGIMLTDRDFEQLLSVIDKDRSGQLDYNEFAKHLAIGEDRSSPSEFQIGYEAAEREVNMRTIGKKRIEPTFDPDGPLPSGSRPILTTQQVDLLAQLSRVLDVFTALDCRDNGKLKDHDLSVGFHDHLGTQVTAGDAKRLLKFLASTDETCSRVDWARAFMNHERICEAPKVVIDPRADESAWLPKGAKHRSRMERHGSRDFASTTPRSAPGVTPRTKAGVQRHSSATLSDGRARDYELDLRGRPSPRYSSRETRRQQPTGEILEVGYDASRDEYDKAGLLRRVPLFASLPPAFLKYLEPFLKKVVLPTKRFVVRQNDFGDSMYFIADGAVDIVSGVSDRSEFRLNPGDCFGELALLFRDRRTRSVRSYGMVTLYKLSATDFETAVKKFPQVRNVLLRMAEQRRLQAVKGGSIPDIFRKIAPVVCDEMISLDLSHKREWSFGLPIWELRTLLKEVLILWSDDDIDWLIAGSDSSVEQKVLTNNDPKQTVDYRGVFRLDKEDDEAWATSPLAHNKVWQGWRQVWSKRQERHYFYNAQNSESLWDPPDGSPWAQELAQSLQDNSQINSAPAPPQAVPEWIIELGDEISSRNGGFITKVFRNFDENKDGTLDPREFRTGLSRCGIELSDNKFEELLDFVDEDGSGEIDYYEFATKLTKNDHTIDGVDLPSPTNKNKNAATHNFGVSAGKLPKWWLHIKDKIESKSLNVRSLFRTFDVDRSGTVDVAEFRRGLMQIGVAIRESEFEQLLMMVDADGGGSIDYNEFAKNITSDTGGSDLRRAVAPEEQNYKWVEETFNKLSAYVERQRLPWDKAYVHFCKKKQLDMSNDDFYTSIRAVNSTLSTDQLETLRSIVEPRAQNGVTLDSWLSKFDVRCHSPHWEQESFERLYTSMRRKRTSLRDLIQRIDTDNSGTVGVAELARGIMGVDSSFGREEATDLARTVDTKAGVVNLGLLKAKLHNEPVEGQKHTRVLDLVRAKFLSHQSPEEIDATFKKFDFDGNGSLSKEEFSRGSRGMGIKLSKQQIDEVFTECDEDGDGELDFDEFVTKVLKQEPLAKNQIQNIRRQLQLAVFDLSVSWKELFNSWDRSSSGFLSQEQFSDGLTSIARFKGSLSPKTLDGIFVTADADKDSLLSFAEFRRFFAPEKQEAFITKDVYRCVMCWSARHPVTCA